MNHIFKRNLLVRKNLGNLRTVFRSISGADVPKYDNYNKDKSYRSQKIYYGILGATTITCIGLYKLFDEYNNFKYVHTKEADEEEEEDIEAGVAEPELHYHTAAEVRQHNTMETRVWVAYKEGVYDITDFVESHPGGKIILKAGGGSLEPFWSIYGIHKCNEVYQMLESLRIANITKEESAELAGSLVDPYQTDPPRSSSLSPCSNKPFNAEPYPSSLLVKSFNTPNDIFYVRNHLPVPVIDPKTYNFTIEVDGTDIKQTLSIEELKKKYEVHTVNSVLMCAGNRRTEMYEMRPLKGLSWGTGAIGNATWTGVYLRDVLMDMGVKDDDRDKYKHIQMEGNDIDPNIAGRFYGASVPFVFVMHNMSDVLLAYEMNGEPLSRDHGAPLRVIVPGVCGARNVKWLSKIVICNNESEAFWQRNDYKSFNPSTQFDDADFTKAHAIQRLPVTSATCIPQPGDNVFLDNGKMTVKGYAYSGGGASIYRVDVSIDQGITWHIADLEMRDEIPPFHWSWTLWTIKIPVEPEKEQVEIWVKAMDSNHNTQPETFEHIWNIRGILANAYHRIKVNIKHTKGKGKAAADGKCKLEKKVDKQG